MGMQEYISNINVDFSGNYTLQGDEILSVALDLAGIFDPSGVADGFQPYYNKRL